MITFIFYALVHNAVECGGLKFEIKLADVETINQKAGRDYQKFGRQSKKLQFQDTQVLRKEVYL